MKSLQMDEQAGSPSNPALMDISERKAFIQFTDSDAEILLQLKPLVEPQVPRLIELFYDRISQYSELMGIIDTAGSTVSRLKQSMQGYLINLFSGSYDDQYFKERCRIGQVHNAIGLSPRWYLGAYSIYSAEITKIICKKYRFSPGKMQDALNSVYKILNLDTQLGYGHLYC